MKSISPSVVPPAGFANVHRIGRVLHSNGPLPYERVVSAVRNDISYFAARNVLRYMLKKKHVKEVKGLLDISPTLRAHYDDVVLHENEQKNKKKLPLTPPRLRYEFKPLSAGHIPSPHGTRPDAPRREVPGFVTLGGWDVDDAA